MTIEKPDAPTSTPTAPAQGAAQSEFTIQRIYIKDISFEAPSAPAIFQEPWTPDLNLQIQTLNHKLAEDVFEVILKITATIKSGDKNAFLIEVQQAGIFTIKNFDEKQIGPMLGVMCPHILFPYAREIISDMASRGTFPPLYLAPINFDVLYQEHLKRQQKPENVTTH